MRSIIYILFLVIVFSACKNSHSNQQSNQVVEDNSIISYQITGTLPHDTSSFTEGFLVHENRFFESTGSPEELSYARSVYGPVDTVTGKIDIKTELDRNKYFGEGIIFLKNKIYQLTYKNQLCFVYDAKTYKKIGEFKYPNSEGWGMTTDSTYIIMSDGTNILSFINPDNFQIVKTLQVSNNNYVVNNINELELIKGYIYANIWPDNQIVKIDTATGQVVGKIDLTPLKQQALNKYGGSLETNGIAYNPKTDKIYVTGKMWPYIFEIQFKH